MTYPAPVIRDSVNIIVDLTNIGLQVTARGQDARETLEEKAAELREYNLDELCYAKACLNAERGNISDVSPVLVQEYERVLDAAIANKSRGSIDTTKTEGTTAITAIASKFSSGKIDARTKTSGDVAGEVGKGAEDKTLQK